MGDATWLNYNRGNTDSNTVRTKLRYFKLTDDERFITFPHVSNFSSSVLHMRGTTRVCPPNSYLDRFRRFGRDHSRVGSGAL